MTVRRKRRSVDNVGVIGDYNVDNVGVVDDYSVEYSEYIVARIF